MRAKLNRDGTFTISKLIIDNGDGSTSELDVAELNRLRALEEYVPPEPTPNPTPDPNPTPTPTPIPIPTPEDISDILGYKWTIPASLVTEDVQNFTLDMFINAREHAALFGRLEPWKRWKVMLGELRLFGTLLGFDGFASHFVGTIPLLPTGQDTVITVHPISPNETIDTLKTSTVTSDTFLFDFKDNYGKNYLGVRKIVFRDINGDPIDITPADVVSTGASSVYADEYSPSLAFMSTTSVTGPYNNSAWICVLDTMADQRLYIKLNREITVTAIDIYNLHSDGNDTIAGVKATTVYQADPNSPTDPEYTTYGSQIGVLALNQFIVPEYTSENPVMSNIPIVGYVDVVDHTDGNILPFVAATASSSYGASSAASTLDGSASVHWANSGGITGNIIYDLGADNAMVFEKFAIQAHATANEMVELPKIFQLRGSMDASNWTVLRTVTEATGWVTNEKREYKFDNTESFRYYQINIDANNGGTYTSIGEVFFYITNGAREYNVIGTPVDKTGKTPLWLDLKTRSLLGTLAQMSIIKKITCIIGTPIELIIHAGTVTDTLENFKLDLFFDSDRYPQLFTGAETWKSWQILAGEEVCDVELVEYNRAIDINQAAVNYHWDMEEITDAAITDLIVGKVLSTGSAALETVDVYEFTNQVTSDTFVFDFADNYGYGDLMCVRQIVPLDINGEPIVVAADDILAAVGTSSWDDHDYHPQLAFDTSNSVLDGWAGKSWVSVRNAVTNQRIAVTYKTAKTISGFRVVNGHNSSNSQDSGAKNTKVYAVPEGTTLTEAQLKQYNYTTGLTQIWDGILGQHPPLNANHYTEFAVAIKTNVIDKTITGLKCTNAVTTMAITPALTAIGEGLSLSFTVMPTEVPDAYGYWLLNNRDSGSGAGSFWQIITFPYGNVCGIRCMVYNDTGEDFSVSARRSLPINQCTDVYVYLSDTIIELWVDGVYQGETPLTGTFSKSVVRTMIGARGWEPLSNPEGKFVGILDNLRQHKTKLAPAEIVALVNEPKSKVSTAHVVAGVPLVKATEDLNITAQVLDIESTDHIGIAGSDVANRIYDATTLRSYGLCNDAVVDSSLTPVNGTATGTTTVSSRIGTLTEFNGIDAFIDLGEFTPPEQFTVGMFIKFKDFDLNQYPGFLYSGNTEEGWGFTGGDTTGKSTFRYATEDDNVIDAQFDVIDETNYPPEGQYIQFVKNAEGIRLFKGSTFESSLKRDLYPSVAMNTLLIDIADNHSDGSFMGVRRIDLFDEYGQVITIDEAGIEAATSSGTIVHAASHAFLSSTILVGDCAGNCWEIQSPPTNIRLGVKFASTFNVSKVRIHNFVSEGAYTTRGIKTVNISTAEVASVTTAQLNTYNGELAGAVTLFEGDIPIHAGGDTDDYFDIKVEVPAAPTTVRSDVFVFDFSETYGGTTYIAVKKIILYDENDEVITLTADDMVYDPNTSHLYATSFFGDFYPPENLFLSTTNPVGDMNMNSWLGATTTPQRVCLKLAAARSVSKIEIVNFNHLGLTTTASTSAGAKWVSVSIPAANDYIPSTVFEDMTDLESIVDKTQLAEYTGGTAGQLFSLSAPLPKLAVGSDTFVFDFHSNWGYSLYMALRKVIFLDGAGQPIMLNPETDIKEVVASSTTIGAEATYYLPKYVFDPTTPDTGDWLVAGWVGGTSVPTNRLTITLNRPIAISGFRVYNAHHSGGYYTAGVRRASLYYLPASQSAAFSTAAKKAYDNVTQLAMLWNGDIPAHSANDVAEYTEFTGIIPAKCDRPVIAKRIRLECSHNWGTGTSWYALRGMFPIGVDGSEIPIAYEGTALTSSAPYDVNHAGRRIIDNRVPVTGPWNDNGYLTDVDPDPVVFIEFTLPTPIVMRGMRIHNGHDGTNLGGVSLGFRDIEIKYSPDDTTPYKTGFKGTLRQHEAADTAYWDDVPFVKGDATYVSNPTPTAILAPLPDLSTVESDTFVFDIADNWGNVNYLGIRQLTFFGTNNEEIIITEDMIDYAVASSIYAYTPPFLPKWVFISGTPKIGTTESTSWVSDYPTNQRLTIKLKETIRVSGFSATNIIGDNNDSTSGARNTRFSYLPVTAAPLTESDAITYQASDALIELWSGEIERHPGPTNAVEHTVEYTNLIPVPVASSNLFLGRLGDMLDTVYFSKVALGRLHIDNVARSDAWVKAKALAYEGKLAVEKNPTVTQHVFTIAGADITADQLDFPLDIYLDSITSPELFENVIFEDTGDVSRTSMQVGDYNPSYKAGPFDNSIASGNDSGGSWYCYRDGSYRNTGRIGQKFDRYIRLSGYRIYFNPALMSGGTSAAPVSWEFIGVADDGTETILHSATGITISNWWDGVIPEDARGYYNEYYLNVTQNNLNTSYLVIHEIEFIEEVPTSEDWKKWLVQVGDTQIKAEVASIVAAHHVTASTVTFVCRNGYGATSIGIRDIGFFRNGVRIPYMADWVCSATSRFVPVSDPTSTGFDVKYAFMETALDGPNYPNIGWSGAVDQNTDQFLVVHVPEGLVFDEIRYVNSYSSEYDVVNNGVKDLEIYVSPVEHGLVTDPIHIPSKSPLWKGTLAKHTGTTAVDQRPIDGMYPMHRTMHAALIAKVPNLTRTTDLSVKVSMSTTSQEAFIGKAGSVPAAEVWGGAAKMVQNMGANADFVSPNDNLLIDSSNVGAHGIRAATPPDPNNVVIVGDTYKKTALKFTEDEVAQVNFKSLSLTGAIWAVEFTTEIDKSVDDGAPAYTHFFSGGTWGSSIMVHADNATGVLYTGSLQTARITTPADFIDHAINRWVAVHDGTNMLLYRNGVLVASVAATDVPVWDNADGVHYMSLIGTYHHLRVFNKVLTPEWIALRNKSDKNELLTYTKE